MEGGAKHFVPLRHTPDRTLNNYKTQVMSHLSPVGFFSLGFQVTPMSDRDFGRYNCTARNNIGIRYQEFILAQAGECASTLPSPPIIRLMSSFSDSPECARSRGRCAATARLLRCPSAPLTVNSLICNSQRDKSRYNSQPQFSLV